MQTYQIKKCLLQSKGHFIAFLGTSQKYISLQIFYFLKIVTSVHSNDHFEVWGISANVQNILDHSQLILTQKLYI